MPIALPKSYSAWREFIIRAGGASYVVGLLFWQFYAWRNRLGTASPINLQYFMAGAIVFIGVICSTLLAVAIVDLMAMADQKKALLSDKFSVSLAKILIGMSEFSRRAMGKDPTDTQESYRQAEEIRRFLIISINFVLGSVLYLILAFWIYICFSKEQNLLGGCAVLILMSLSIYLINSPPVHRMNLKEMNALAKLLTKTATSCAAFFIIGLGGFWAFAYPEIPQEFGGGKPKLCYLDLEKEKISDYIICELVNREPIDDSSEENFMKDCRNRAAYLLGLVGDNKGNNPFEKDMKVLHTKQVELWNNSPDSIIVRVPSVAKSTYKFKDKPYHVIRIPISMVLSMTIHSEAYGDHKSAKSPQQGL